MSVLTGYGIHINQLRKEDVEEHKIDLGDCSVEDCIAVHGEDLVRELAYVVVPSSTPRVIWCAPDVRTLHATEGYNFASSVVRVARAVLPEFNDLLNASQ